MAKYTIELRSLHSDPNFEIFGFDFDFYSDSNLILDKFKQKFIQNYYFHEINSESVHRWQWMLKNRLDKIMPYYKQLYETELASKDINFLLNKDYEETFERELINNTKSNTTSTSVGDSTSSNKTSSLNNGISSVNLEPGSLTGVSEIKDKDNATSNANSVGEGTEKEINKLIGKGNIGITSSAELLQKWREVLINIDELIIDECRDLFMLIY